MHYRKESRTITQASLIRGLNQACFSSLLSILNFVTFSSYTGLGNVLTPRKVFTVITLFSIMRLFFYFLLVLGALGMSEIWVSLKRIKVNNTVHCQIYEIQRNLCIMDSLGPEKSIPIIKVSSFSRSFYMKKCHLGPHLSVWIIQVSIFSSVHVTRFHCSSFVRMYAYIRKSNVLISNVCTLE